MGFSKRDKLKALAIVHIFETSKPLGDYSAVAVLNDGAGISYGINQFTHRAGSLAAVIDRYIRLSGKTHVSIVNALPDLRARKNIALWSANSQLKTALSNLGSDPLMQQAQREIAFEKYMGPAIEACEGSDFVLPLSLAVVYDSINHGSFDKIRDRVVINPPGNGSMKPEEFEKLWITTYARKRDAWLESIPRLASTDYRTDFFLAQIARENWTLELPVSVHGFRLTDAHIDAMLPKETTFADLRDDEIILDIPRPVTAEPQPKPQANQPEIPTGTTGEQAVQTPQAEAPIQNAEKIVNVGGEQTVPVQPPPASLVPVTTGVIEVEQVKAATDEPPKEDVLTRVQNRFLAIPAAIFAAVGSAVTWATSAPTTLVIVLIAVGALIILGYIVTNAVRNAGKERREAVLKAEREKRAHELQVLTLKSAMEKDLNTVRIIPQPIANSDAAKEVGE